ncbi:DeoR/GlpR transcriptional regulator [Actinospica durhamensis]|uniref:DeoR/GlpR transcriptional regulator n=1 Tax=Actinospica durhamensis TaxID=1508375 RepID=A0A941EUD1_9ACTN|nr:DeoR/GlpR family DNA-binding transcription regulator [Actinospica durhamensis]MBR7836628.1 DeoR/GlpR transcriptional regulator [Actinospica durhamensis]
MKRYERLDAILELLARDGKLDVDTAAARLGASEATIRRDLEYLAEQQLLTRTHGGAVANSTSYDLPLRFKSGRQSEAKQRIGQAAAALVPAGGVVGINGGTTTTEAARALGARADLGGAGDGSGLTVVTNALNIAYELTLRPHIKTVVTGGVARASSYELTGPLATGILDRLQLDVALLGVDALDPEWGATAHHEGEAVINQLMAERARSVIVLADATKLAKRAFARIRPIEQVHTLVTDEDADAEVLARFSAAGVRVVTA